MDTMQPGAVIAPPFDGFRMPQIEMRPTEILDALRRMGLLPTGADAGGERLPGACRRTSGASTCKRGRSA